VNNWNDLNDVGLGWPIDFVSQSYSKLEPPGWWFPKNFGLGAPQEYSIHIYPGSLIIGVVINFLIIFGVLFIVFKFNPNLHLLRKIISIKYIMSTLAVAFVTLVSYFIFGNLTRPQTGEGIPPPQIPLPVMDDTSFQVLIPKTNTLFKSRSKGMGEKGVYNPFSMYSIRDGKVYYYNREILGIDIATLQEIEDGWLKDKDYVYWNGNRQMYLDNATIKVFPRVYVSDKNGVWVYATGYHGRVDKTEADPATFSVIGHGYGKDSNNVYYFAEKIMDADMPSFALLRGTEYPSSEGLASNWYAKDKDKVFYRSGMLEGADTQSIVFLGREYAKDKNRVYYRGEVLLNADTNSFSFIANSYVKDKNYVFFGGKILDIEIDPNSFTIVDIDFIKDNQRVYFHNYYNKSYDLMQGVDALTFEYIGSCKCVEKSCGSYFKDKNKIFIGDKPVDSIDVSSFQYFDSYPVRDGEVPYSVSYAKDKNAVYYDCGKVLEGADPVTFTDLSDGYAEDKNNKYLYGKIIVDDNSNEI